MSTTNKLQRGLRAEQSLPRFEPCLPRPAKEPPTGPGWIHEIKHDGFRIIAQRDDARPALHADTTSRRLDHQRVASRNRLTGK